MRTTRAFIASVPLAIVLVAALVVPLTVIPGTFAFETWPTSLDGKVSASPQVRVEPFAGVVAVRVPQPAKASPKARSRDGLTATRNRGQAAPAAPPGPGTRSPPTSAVTLHGHAVPAEGDAP